MLNSRSRTANTAARFQSLDVLRGVAALWVFTFHYGFSDQFRQAFGWLTPIFRAGHLGVPMFFAISGYCLMASVRVAWRDGDSVLSFLRRRSLRIYPPYWCSLAVVAALPFVIEAVSSLKTGTYFPPSSEGNINYGFLDYGPLEWLRIATLTQVFAPLAKGAPQSLQFKFTTINAVYWTLAIEFQFYLVMAVALAVKSRAIRWLAVVTLVSIPIWYVGTWHVVGIFLPYWPMFAVGIFLYLLVEHGFSCQSLIGTNHRSAAILAVLALVGGFLVATVYGWHAGDTSFALMFGVVLWFAHALDDTYRGQLHGPHAAIRILLGLSKQLGLMSYSLYLLHGRLQFLAAQLCRQVLSGIIMDIAVIGLTCVMCYVFYRLCERPFVRTRVSPAPTNTPAPVAATSVWA